MKKYLGALLLLAVLAAAGYILFAPKRQSAPAFALPNLQGQNMDQTALQGKVTLINFWFPYCPGCITKMPKPTVCSSPCSTTHKAIPSRPTKSSPPPPLFWWIKMATSPKPM